MTPPGEQSATAQDSNAPAAQHGPREVVVSRIIDAPRDLIFKVWTDPAQVGAWWGPRGFTITTHEHAFEVGGLWKFTMHGPDGTDYPNDITFLEIDRPARLVYEHGPTPKFTTVVTFADRDGRTDLTMRSEFPTVEERNMVVEKFGAIEGGFQTLERLADYARNQAGRKPGLTITRLTPESFLMERTFNAPAQAVFDAWTRPEHVRQWFGRYGDTMPVCEIDLRVGGAWRLLIRNRDGSEMGMFGEYREIAGPQRLVYTESFDDFAEAGAAVNTMLLEHSGSKTTMKVTCEYPTVTAVDAMLGMGMERGAGETLDRLDDYLSTMS